MTAPMSEDGDQRQALLAEYEMVAESWRFLTGIRFALLTFAATLLFALLGGYAYVESNLEKLGLLGQNAQWAIPGFGLVTTAAVVVIEERTRKLYAACLTRGKKIEVMLGLKIQLETGAHFHELWAAPVPLGFASHTWAIRFIYIFIALTWSYLALWAFAH